MQTVKQLAAYLVITALMIGHSLQSCYTIDKIESKYKSDFLLVGMYPTRVSILSRYNANAFMRMEATRYAIEEGNKLLQSLKIPLRIGYILYDDCNALVTVAKIVLDFVLGIEPQAAEKLKVLNLNESCICDNQVHQKVLGIIGTASSGPAVHLNSYVEPENIPTISYGATSVALSDKILYPQFLRTIPSDKYQALLIIDLIRKFSWTYVTLIHKDDTYGRTGRDALHSLFKTYNICTSAVHSYQGIEQIPEIIQSLHEKELSKVVILWTNTVAAIRVLNSAAEYNVFDKTWLLTEAVARSSRILKEVHPRIIRGALTITPYTGQYTAFNNFFWNIQLTNREEQPWLDAFMRSVNGDNYDGRGDTLHNYSNELETEKAGFPRNAAFAYIHALINYYQDKKNTTSNIAKDFDRREYFDKYLTKVQFTGLANETFGFDEHGNPSSPMYHVYAIQQSEQNRTLFYLRVAEWSARESLKWVAKMTWVNESTEPTVSRCAEPCSPGKYAILDGQTNCCWTCVPCPSETAKSGIGNQECTPCGPGSIANANHTACLNVKRGYLSVDNIEGVVIVVEAVFATIVILLHMTILLKHRHTPIARSSNLQLSIMQLGSQLLMSMSLLLFLDSATTLICTAQLVTMGTFLTVTLSITLVKTEQLLRIFHMQKLVSRKARLVTKSMQLFTIVFVTIINWCLIAASALSKPITIKTTLDKELLEERYSCNNDYHLVVIIIYEIVLCLACAIQAIRARNLPANFNEAKYIAYATFTSCVLLGSIIPWYSSIRDTSTKLLVLCTFLCLTNVVLMLLMYSYKIRIILFEPHLNNVTVFQRTSAAFSMAEVDNRLKVRHHRRLAGSTELTSMCDDF